MGINEYIRIGEKIKQTRISAGLSQKEMAQKLGLSISTYSNYENGHREPPLEIIKAICDIVGTDLSVLILGTGTKEKEDTTNILEVSPQNIENNEDLFEHILEKILDYVCPHSFIFHFEGDSTIPMSRKDFEDSYATGTSQEKADIINTFAKKIYFVKAGNAYSVTIEYNEPFKHLREK